MLEAKRLADTLPEGNALAAALVARGWLTEYQAGEIGAGRWAGLLVGPYVLLAKLGEGGMGEVFRAREKFTQDLVALKRMKAALLGNRP